MKFTIILILLIYSSRSFSDSWQYFADVDYGIRNDSYGRGDFSAARGGWTRKHTGIDYLLDYNTLLYSPCDGIARWKKEKAFGYSVDVVCASPFESTEKLRSYYFSIRFSHVDRDSLFITNNEKEIYFNVSRGENIAIVGNSGNAISTKPHVHLEISVHRTIDSAKNSTHSLKDEPASKRLETFIKRLSKECEFVSKIKSKRTIGLDYRLDPHIIFTCLDLMPEQMSSHDLQEDDRYPGFYRWEHHY